MELGCLGDEQETIPWPNLPSEAHIFQTSEADEVPPAMTMLGAVVRAKLRRRFTNKSARKYRIVREMPASPELVFSYVFITGNHVLIRIDMDDGRQLLHFKALRIDLADTILVHHDLV